ncbi:uncharacterized protein LTR77_010031 [Saxophila tyrrhenica]|uniref:SET domain-containing protein n=1 Tax=Saxophila tyrrhenica TaxID=1690608 RepID=A0AAV9NX95_9PEZI|nr:hypothetical protein LTR77_010031 [Saxophila tyrrhenica]
MPPRAAKRPRVADEVVEPSAQDGSDLDEHQLFTQWAKAGGVEIHGVAPKRIEGRGIGLVTTMRHKAGDRLLFIPERAMFKPDAKLLEREKLQSASPQAQLAFSAMFACKPPEGNTGWETKPWTDVWPTVGDFTASMPIYWRKEDCEFLPPTARPHLKRQESDYDRDWDSVEDSCTALGYDEKAFKYYWTIVNSRSFHWKPPRGKGVMVMCPFVDYLNHGPTGSSCKVVLTAKGYEVLADRKYKPGEEVLATYGAHSNDKLLVHYGFIHWPSDETTPSPDDSISLDDAIMPKFSTDTREQLEHVGYCGGYMLTPTTNEICFRTEVAVRATLLTANEWEYFLGSGEDLAEDQSARVHDWVMEHLKEWRATCLGKMSELEKRPGTPKPVLEVTCRRWAQISEAVDRFVAQ